MPFGRSYQPGGEQGNGTGPKRPPVQEAVRLLGLRLPSVLGAQAPSPMTLLRGQGSQGFAPGNMSIGAIIEMLRKIAQGGSAGAFESGGGSDAAGFSGNFNIPTPSFDWAGRPESEAGGDPAASMGGGTPNYPGNDILNAAGQIGQPPPMRGIPNEGPWQFDPADMAGSYPGIVANPAPPRRGPQDRYSGFESDFPHPSGTIEELPPLY